MYYTEAFRKNEQRLLNYQSFPMLYTSDFTKISIDYAQVYLVQCITWCYESFYLMLQIEEFHK